jgi:hypothetical protein
MPGEDKTLGIALGDPREPVGVRRGPDQDTASKR